MIRIEMTITPSWRFIMFSRFIPVISFLLLVLGLTTGCSQESTDTGSNAQQAVETRESSTPVDDSSGTDSSGVISADREPNVRLRLSEAA